MVNNTFLWVDWGPIFHGKRRTCQVPQGQSHWHHGACLFGIHNFMRERCSLLLSITCFAFQVVQNMMMNNEEIGGSTFWDKAKKNKWLMVCAKIWQRVWLNAFMPSLFAGTAMTTTDYNWPQQLPESYVLTQHLTVHHIILPYWDSGSDFWLMELWLRGVLAEAALPPKIRLEKVPSATLKWIQLSERGIQC